MPNGLSGDSVVEYSVKELLDEQTDLLRRIDKKVDGKADKADVYAIGARVDTLAGRVDRIEDHQLADEERRSVRRRLWAVIGSVTATSAVIVAALIQVNFHVHFHS